MSQHQRRRHEINIYNSKARHDRSETVLTPSAVLLENLKAKYDAAGCSTGMHLGKNVLCAPHPDGNCLVLTNTILHSWVSQIVSEHKS